MILPDSSAWIEYLRRTESAADLRLTAALESAEEVATTGPVRLEVFAGIGAEARAAELAGLFSHTTTLPVEDPTDYDSAAAIYRGCRRAGHTIAGLQDCLIAAVAIRTGAELLHCDSDFDPIAELTPLRVVPLD